MQVVAPGFVKSAGISNDHVQSRTRQDRGFADLLSERIQPQNLSGDVEESVTKDTGQLSNEELTNLIQLLNASDLTEIEFESTLLNNLLSDVETDMTALVKEGLQLSDESILSGITAFLKGININTEKENSVLSEEELLIRIEELPQMEVNEAMAAFINILPFINLDQMTLTTDQSFANLAKSLKLIEVFSHYEKFNVDQQKIKGFLQKITEKLEALLKENALTDRMEFLNKVFNPIVREVNERGIINRQTQLIISTNQPFNEQMSEEAVVKPILINGADQQGLENRQTSPVISATDQLINETVSEKTVINPNSRLIPIQGDLFSIQHMSKPMQIMLMQNSSGKPVSTEQLIQQFESILSKSQFLNTSGSQKLFIQLNPEHLGALRIELIQKESVLIAKMMTTNSTAKDLLESQIQSLKNAFSSQNIQVEKIEVSQQMNQQERFTNNRDSQQEQRERKEQDEQKQRHDLEIDISFEEALLNVEV